MKKPVLVTIDQEVLDNFKRAFPTTKRSTRIQALLEKELETHKMSEKDKELANQCFQIAARLNVIEEALAINVQKDVSPTPANAEKSERAVSGCGIHCPRCQSWNVVSTHGTCVCNDCSNTWKRDVSEDVEKDLAPTPAPIEEQEPECPPGFKWDEATQRCIETQPAPAVQKTEQATPAKLVEEAKRRRAQGIY